MRPRTWRTKVMYAASQCNGHAKGQLSRTTCGGGSQKLLLPTNLPDLSPQPSRDHGQGETKPSNRAIDGIE